MKYLLLLIVMVSFCSCGKDCYTCYDKKSVEYNYSQQVPGMLQNEYLTSNTYEVCDEDLMNYLEKPKVFTSTQQIGNTTLTITTTEKSNCSN